MLYRLEQRIHTLANIAIDHTETGSFGFSVDDVTFSSWQVGKHDGYWTHDYWLATSELEAADYGTAWHLFTKSLVRIASPMTLVSQCYTEFLYQPILIERRDLKIAFIWWVLDRARPTGLMFMEDEKSALELLLGRSDIPKAFFYYWRDAVNTFGYSSRLMLMLSAVEALTDIPYAERKAKRDTFYARLELILGKELKEIFWGTKGSHANALRHRLTHGEYFDPLDTKGIDYRGVLHTRIMQYFNEAIFKDQVLNTGVVNAPRHPFGNADQAISFLRPREHAKLALIDVLAEATEHGIDNLVNYENVHDEEIRNNF